MTGTTKRTKFGKIILACAATLLVSGCYAPGYPGYWHDHDDRHGHDRRDYDRGDRDRHENDWRGRD